MPAEWRRGARRWEVLPVPPVRRIVMLGVGESGCLRCLRTASCRGRVWAAVVGRVRLGWMMRLLFCDETAQ